MPLNNIKFNLGQGGLGRPLPGEDYISGLVFYVANGSLPSGFSTTNRIKQCFSVADAESAGILAAYADGTSAAGSWTSTVIGTNGDTVTIKIAGFNGTLITLGTYTKTATETTTTLIAAAVAAAINANTITHGFVASPAAAIVTITAPKSYGIFLNTGTPITAVYSASATLLGTIIQFTGGVASLQAVWHYHIAEYFRIQPQGSLYVAFYPIPTTYDFTDITTVQQFANGKIRQVGVYKDGSPLAASGADLTALSAVCNTNVGLHKELIGLLGADISGTALVSTLFDNSTLTANLASVVIAQDGAALGSQLYLAYGKSITALGALLGAVSLAKVSEDIAWPSKFNMSNGTELDTIAFANGKLFSDVSITDALLTQLQNSRYIFLRKFTGFAGSYWNEDVTAIAASSNYCFISGNRTIQKATRGVYASLVPALNSSVILNADGTISDNAIAAFITLAEVNLLQMLRNGEISAQQVLIDPTQNILATGILNVTVKIVPTAIARNIVVNIGFNISL